MHVLVIIGRYPPDHSGAGLRISRTYEAMRAQNAALVYDVIAEPVRIENAPADPAHVTRLDSALPVPMLALRLFRAMWEKRSHIDLVHCIGPTRMTVLGAFFAKIMGLPCVTETSLDYDAAAKAGNPLHRFLLARYYRPDGVIALTPRIADVYRSFGAEDADIYLRPNPVMMDASEALSAQDAELLALIEKMPAAYRHLVLGRFGVRKNQQYAIDMLAQLPEAHGLVLAGPVLEEEDYVAMLRDYTAKLGLRERVILWPHAIDNPRLFYRRMTSLWCPSLAEGLPNVVLEMLWEGGLCFVNDALGLDGYVIDANNGAAFPGGSAAAAASVVARRMAEGYDNEAIRQAAREKFEPSRITAATFRFLSRCSRKDS
jgi:glycosyltransferase involved in cell wall biosynthesis